MRGAGGRGGKARRGVLARVALAAGLLAAGFALLAVTAFHIFPPGVAGDMLKDYAKARGARVSWQAARRTFPFGVRAEGVEVFDFESGRLMLRLDEARARLDLRGLIGGALRFPVVALIGRGAVTARAEVRPGKSGLEMEAAGVELDAIPALASYGLRVKGAVGGTLSLEKPRGGCPSGRARLRSGRLGGDGVSFMGLPLRVGEIERAGLDAEFRGCAVIVEGLWADGDEFSAKLSGRITPADPVWASRLDMKLDITPRGEPSGGLGFLSVLRAYGSSPSFYSVAVRGTLARPIIGR